MSKRFTKKGLRKMRKQATINPNINGKKMQDGNTKTMVFNIKELISYVSHFMTLYPGDIIATGTPPGVGMGMKPPRYLKKGDEMKLGIDGLGVQMQKVVSWKK